MSASPSTVWELRATATANMQNGGGFNPGSANFLTDLAATVANTAAPVVTSASYTFLAGDVGAWVYVKSGTSWTPGWYQIASVGGGAATLTAGVGTAIQVTNSIYGTNTVAGCATVTSPTAGTWGIDYSQQNAAQFNLTNVTTAGVNAILLSASAANSMLGNVVNIISGTNFVPGWYEVTSVSLGVSITLDRNCTTGAGALGVVNVGGALDLNSAASPDAFFEGVVTTTGGVTGGNIIWVKNSANGTQFTLGGTISIASILSNGTNPSFIIGYNALRGDNPIGNLRPTINTGSNTCAWGQNQNIRNVIFVSSSATFTITTNTAVYRNVKVINTNSTANRVAITTNGESVIIGSEVMSLNGLAISAANFNTAVYGCYLHDSAIGISVNTSRSKYLFNLIESCGKNAIQVSGITSSSTVFGSNTLYGMEGKAGIGFQFDSGSAVSNITLLNNIVYGFNTGIVQTNSTSGQSFSNMGLYNDFFNNLVDVSLYTKDYTDIALNPGFASVGQILGTNAISTGFTLFSPTVLAGITTGVDCLHVTGGTSATLGIYLITGVTANSVIVTNTLGSTTANDLQWYIPTGHNLAIGTNLMASGYPGLFYGSNTTGYLDIGAVQRQEPAGGTSSTTTSPSIIVQRNLPDLRLW